MMLTRRLGAGVIVALALSSCATIERREYARDRFLRVDRSTSVVEGSRRLAVESTIEGGTLVAIVTSARTCEEREQTFVERKTVTERSASGFSPGWTCSLGAVLSAGVLIALKDADRCEAGTPALEEYCRSARRDNLTMRIGYPTGLMAPCVVDLFRARDLEKNMGVVSLAPQVRRFECQSGPLVDSEVKVEFDGSEALVGKSDSKGVVRLPLGGLGLAIVRSEAPPTPVLRADGLEREMRLVGSEWRQVRLDLLADPGSRARQQADAACALSLAEATARLTALRTETDLAAARGEWDTLAVTCGQGWTEVRAARWAAANATIEEAAARIAHEACEVTLGRARARLAAGDFTGANEVLTHHPACRSADDDEAARGALMAKIAAATQAAHEAAASRLHDARDRDEALAALARSDLRRAQQIVELDRPVAESLRAHPEGPALVRRVAREVAENVARGAPGVGESCAARSIFTRVLGRTAWEEFAASTTRELARGDALVASRLARSLGGSACP